MVDDERFLLKNLIDRPSVAEIFDAVEKHADAFDAAVAMQDVFDDQFQYLELKQRIRRVATVIREHLPGEYRDALDVLVAAAGELDEPGFTAMALNDFVEEFGTEDFDVSVPAMAVFTELVSAEFAVRPFLRSDLDAMLAVMEKWSASDRDALRRLASEGSRPRLPWGMGVPELKQRPELTERILRQLRHDPSEDVRRSVANHLNDISKDHPDYVVNVLSEWQDGSAAVAEITRHALRTLLKAGDPGALRLLGFDPDVGVVVSDLRIDPEPAPLGGSARAHWTVENPSDEPVEVMVDFRMDYYRDGKRPSRKVFKGAVLSLSGGQSEDMNRKISFAQMSTRRVEAGPHAIEIQVNGVVRASHTFEVLPS